MGELGSFLVATTGNGADDCGSELIDRVQIGDGVHGRDEVAMSLGPGSRDVRRFLKLPDLREGDVLRVVAEVEVTHYTNGDCGPAYDGAPEVRAQLVLAGDAEESGDGGRREPLGRPQEAPCDHEEHHHIFVIDERKEISRDLLERVGETPHLNLALSARGSGLGAGAHVIVGENEWKAKPVGDKGRINVVRIRDDRQPDSKSYDTIRKRQVPVDKSKCNVIASMPLGRVEPNEQFLVTARVKASAAHLGYAARLSLRLLLAGHEGQTGLGGRAGGVAELNGEITENNGFNITRGEPRRTATKAGVMRITGAARDLRINVVAVSSAPFDKGKVKKGDALEIEDVEIELTRFESGGYG